MSYNFETQTAKTPMHRKRNFRRRRRSRQQEVSQTCDGRSSNDGGSASNSVESVDIPGFYYDQEKQRYFRLLPGHNNFNPLTTEDVKSKQAQEENELNYKKRSKHSLYQVGLKEASLFSHYLDILKDRQLGINVSPGSSIRIMANRVANLKLSSTFKLECSYDFPCEDCEFCVGYPEDGIILGTWGMETGTAIQAGLLSVSEPNEDGATSLLLHDNEIIDILPNQKVNDMYVVDYSPDLKFALFCSVCSLGRHQTFSTINFQPIRKACNDAPETRQMCDALTQSCEFPLSVVWSCTYSKANKSIAFGFERQGMMKGIDRDAWRNVYTNKEKPFSCAFDNVGNNLYFGTHKGNVLCSDLRENFTNRVSYSFPLERGITYIKLLSNDTTMIASAYDGNLLQVDMRQRKSVLKYDGHVNHFGKVPFSVDEDINMLCCTGKDKRTRFWALKEGHILSDHNLASFIGPSQHTEPWTCFSSHWCQNKSNMEKLAVVITCDTSVYAYE